MLLIFSTNLNPSDLMDPAFLRRIQYKIKVFPPTVDEYWKIFDSTARSHELELTDEVFEYVIGRLDQLGLAYYQPKFICEHVIEACRCLKLPPHLTEELAGEALANLYFDIADSANLVRAARTLRRVPTGLPLAQDEPFVDRLA
jgi:SpoVK/Ycf46/Vps4 family AAA+-type ATPase